MKREFRKVDVPKKTYKEMSRVEESGNSNIMTDEGEGLPYAPEDFLCQGDKWRWRVGKRAGITGYHRDRFLYPPARLFRGKNSHNKHGFASKVSAERYIRREFPDMDVAAAFFASFSWMVLAKRIHSENGSAERQTFCSVPRRETVEHANSDSNGGYIGCRAQNQMWCSLNLRRGKANMPSMPCDMCCSMTGFCRDCCCILCYKSIDSTNECIGLDAEYFCRRCDSRTELISHVRIMMETCRLVDSRDEVEKVLNLCICILQGSPKDSARSLLSHIESVSNKIKSGTPLEETWTQGSIPGTSFRTWVIILPDVADYIDFDVGPDIVLDEPVCYDYQIQSLKLDDESNNVLQQLKKSQELEFKITEDMFYAHKHYLQNLHQQLKGRVQSWLANHYQLSLMTFSAPCCAEKTK